MIFTVPKTQWLTANGRYHWSAEARRKKLLRQMGFIVGKNSGLQFTTPIRVIAHIGYATAGRADPANTAPTVKALIDGLVDAGVFVDDSHEWVIGPDFRRDTKKCARGYHTVRFEFEEVR